MRYQGKKSDVLLSVIDRLSLHRKALSYLADSAAMPSSKEDLSAIFDMLDKQTQEALNILEDYFKAPPLEHQKKKSC